MLKQSSTELPDETPKLRNKKKIEKAPEGVPAKPFEEFGSVRNSDGFLSSLEMPRKVNGLVDWRQLISKEHLALNRFNLATRGVAVENLSQDEVSKLIDESPEEDLVIKLAGFRELATIRGYREINPDLVQCTPDSVTIKVTIEWIPNAELDTWSRVGAIANASLNNTDQVFAKFLATIAENRAFIRAVRHSLGIISIGQDEVSQDDVKVEAQNIKIQSLLQKGLEKAGVDLLTLRMLVAAEGFEWNDKWVSVDRIDPAAAMSFIPLIQKLSEQ